LSFALADRLSMFDKQQLITLRSNARRLEGETGPRADEAKALLPLIEEELAKRVSAAAALARAKRKA
jgi:hypothetical protein